MLLAETKVKEDKVTEYLEIADKTDKSYEADKPGMLHHILLRILIILLVLYGQKFIKTMILNLLI